MNEVQDRIAKMEPREKPEAKQILNEIRYSIISAQSLGVFDKVESAHMTRRNLWAGQSLDGMVHGEDAFPWNGAIDTRVPLVEEIVSDHVRVRMSALRSGNVGVEPEDVLTNASKAQLWDKVMKYYRNHGRVKRKMMNHLKLFFTCVEELGYGVMKVDWRDFKALKPVTVTREQVVAFRMQEMLTDMMQAGGQAGPNGQQAEPPKEWQAQAAQSAAEDVEEMLSDAKMKWAAVQLLMRLDATMAKKEALRIVGPLGKTGTAVYYASRGAGGLPVLRAKIPWVNCLHGSDLGPDGETSWWADVEWLSELDVRVRCEQEGCDAMWMEEVLKQPNKGLYELMTPLTSMPRWVLNGVGIGLSPAEQQMQRAPMFQILTVHRLAVNEAGVPACYETMLHPMVPELLGKHECCEVTELPWVCEMREPAALAVQSRGIAELSQTDQLALKKLKDSITSSAELVAFPPYERAMGDNNRIKPGMELPARRNTGNSSTMSKFLEVPGVDLGALKAMEMTRGDVNHLFMRAVDTDPDSRRRFLEEMGESAVQSYEEIMRLMWLHIQAYVPTMTASRIAGRPVDVSAQLEDLEGTADVTVSFSSLSMNQKTAMELAEYGSKIAGLDRGNRIDWGKFMEVITRVFDPELSEEILMPGDENQAKLEDDTRNVLAQIASGQYITGHTDAPKVRWPIVQQWLQNPDTQGMLQQRPMVLASVQEYVKGLSQEQVQKTDNVFTGQTGMKPDAPWEQADDPAAQFKGMMGGMGGGMK